MDWKWQKLPYRQQQTILHRGRQETGNGRRKFWRMMKKLYIRLLRYSPSSSLRMRQAFQSERGLRLDMMVNSPKNTERTRSTKPAKSFEHKNIVLNGFFKLEAVAVIRTKFGHFSRVIVISRRGIIKCWLQTENGNDISASVKIKLGKNPF